MNTPNTKHIVEAVLVTIWHWWLIFEVDVVEIHCVSERIQLILNFIFNIFNKLFIIHWDQILVLED